MKHQMIRAEFVDAAPKQLNDGVIYISDRIRNSTSQVLLRMRL